MPDGRRDGAAEKAGLLYVVATPIGNMRDITLRAMDILGSVGLVAAEDTRRTGLLLRQLGVSVKILSCREHNENSAAEKVVRRLRDGVDVAFVTDAGTPGISDPAGRLVKRVREAGFSAYPVPGPSAATAAMSVSGFTARSFYFAGFLPARQAARLKALEMVAGVSVPLIFFESPHRIGQVLQDMIRVLGDREAFMGREITKLHETYFTGRLSELEGKFGTEKARGEITLVLRGADESEETGRIPDRMADIERLVDVMLECGLSARDISGLVSAATGLGRGMIYKMANTLKENRQDGM